MARKIIIVDKDFQMRFVRKFVTIALLGTIISLSIILGFYYLTYKHGGRDLTRYLIEVGIDKKIDIDIKDNEGKTPLHLAAIYGHAELVKLLVENGADVNIKDNKGITPIKYAREHNYIEVVQMLLEYGANLD